MHKLNDTFNVIDNVCYFKDKHNITFHEGLAQVSCPKNKEVFRQIIKEDDVSLYCHGCNKELVYIKL